MKTFFLLLSFFLLTTGSFAQVVPPTSLRVYNQNQGNWELGNGYEMRYHGSGKLASITEIDSIANVVLSTRFFEYDSLGRLILDSTQFFVSVGNDTSFESMFETFRKLGFVSTGFYPEDQFAFLKYSESFKKEVTDYADDNYQIEHHKDLPQKEFGDDELPF